MARKRRNGTTATGRPAIVSAGSALMSAAGNAPMAAGLVDIGLIVESLLPRLPIEFRVSVRRPEDHLVLDLVFENLQLTSTTPRRIVRARANSTGILIAEFPPQSFAEEAFLEATTLDDGPVSTQAVADQLPRVRMSGPSRLAVTMPAGVSHLDYTLPAILEALRTWPLRLATTAAAEPRLRLQLGGTFGSQQGQYAAAASLDRAWLRGVTGTANWQSLRTGLRTALTATGGDALSAAVDGAAQRVAERVAASMSAPAGERGTDVDLLMRREFDRLLRSHPQVAHQASRDTVFAAVAIATTESLAQLSVGAEFELSVHEWPFLQLVLRPHAPARSVTALELPYRLILSPLAPSRFTHRDQPVTHAGRTELWHTRLTRAGRDTGPDTPSRVRAIWSPDYPLSEVEVTEVVNDTLPFRMSLDAGDRKALVSLMAGFDLKRNGRSLVPIPSTARRLHLSSLGGLLDAEGNWTRFPNETADGTPISVNVEQWRHLAALGRDHFVRVVYAGYLAPFGHAASLVKVTERKFETVGTGANQRRRAVLRQRFFIIVRERVRSFTGAQHQFGGRNFPFTQVDVLTRVTPNLRAPSVSATGLVVPGEPNFYNTTLTRDVMWPMVPLTSTTSRDFRFEIEATDLAGERRSFTLPLLFVSTSVNEKAAVIASVRKGYNAAAPDRRSAAFAGQSICYAPLGAGENGDTRLPTRRMGFVAGALTAGVHNTESPNFYPETQDADVGIVAVQRLLGRAHATVTVSYPAIYRTHGFGGENPGQLYLINPVHQLGFGDGAADAKSDSLGALVTPQMAIQGLSRVIGPVSGNVPASPQNLSQIEATLAKPISNTFDPKEFLQGAKILGGITLADILTVVNLTGNSVPRLISRELPEHLEARFDWTTTITSSDPLNILVPRADSNKPETALTLSGLTRTPRNDPSAATTESTGELTNFKVNLFGFVIIWFERIRFVTRPGKKPDVTVDLRHGNDAVQFGGPLEFVNKLRDLIPANGFSDPPNLSVTPSGIAASYTLTLPSIEVGVLSISNLSLGAGFNLPFDSRPASVQFSFSQRESPFSLAVSLLGGGGFLMIGISTEGVNEIEAALEFGAQVAIDLGVASGRVEIKAGIYFHWIESGSDGLVEFTGYIRLHGELRVLGLISASLTFNLSLSYQKSGSGSKLVGEATLVVEISLLIFSASVSVRCRREFGGSPADPKFIDLVPSQALWNDYCDAFADEVA